MSVKKLIVRALEDADVVKLKEIIDNEENKTKLSDESMDIVPVTCGHLTKHTQEALPHLVTSCQDLLITLANLGNPKEMLISVLEQLDGFQDTISVIKLLPCLSIVLTRVKLANMSVSWNWALEAVTCHVRTCATPDNMGLEGCERLTLDHTEEASECLELCEACAQLASVLLKVIEDNSEDADNEYRKTVLVNFILNLFVPLSTLSQHLEIDKNKKNVEPASRQVCIRLMEMLQKINKNLWNDVIEFPNSLSRKKLCESGIDKISLPMFSYLLFPEEMTLDHVPSVYTHYYWLRTVAKSIITLIIDSNQMRIHKGLLLLQFHLNRCAPESLDPFSAEDPELTSIITPLVTVIVYQDVAELRQIGFNSYSKFIKIFCPAARYKLYMFLLKTINHSGLLGWTITSLKDTIVKCFAKDEFAIDYAKPKLPKLISPLLKLKHGPETDLLEISEELVASINLFLFLLGRDKQNKTGVLDLKKDVEKWVEEIQTGLKLSVAHYEQKLLEPESSSGDLKNFGVSVGGTELPSMDPAQMKDVIKSALRTFSLIQYSLARLNEVMR